MSVPWMVSTEPSTMSSICLQWEILKDVATSPQMMLVLSQESSTMDPTGSAILSTQLLQRLTRTVWDGRQSCVIRSRMPAWSGAANMGQG